MQKRIYLLIFIFCLALSAHAQTETESFEQARQRMLNNYQTFRQDVKADYAKFLEGVWKEFETFKGVKRDEKPKPKVAPEFNPSHIEPVAIPAPEKPASSPVVTVPQKPVDVPSAPTVPNVIDIDLVGIPFYGVTWNMSGIEAERIVVSDNKSYAKAWHNYDSKGAKEVAKQIKDIARGNGLNDWFTFLLAKAYADEVAKDMTGNERMALVHYLMVNIGYDVRLARTERQTLLLAPFAQKVYERTYINVDGSRMYVFTDNENQQLGNEPLYACQLPDGADCGRVMDLQYRNGAGIKRGDAVKRTVSDGRISLTASVDKCLMEMLRHYPQMDVPEYAKSEILPSLHKEVLGQIGSQIAGLSKPEAANKLIHFVQHAFDYATDGDQHGYEKTYFLEENFYYPKNDCEDRAIFFAFLVRNLLGLDVHLVHFTGHECTAVNFKQEEISGDYYMYEGKRYYICDPTYIGATIGQCMPQYKSEKPEVELW